MGTPCICAGCWPPTLGNAAGGRPSGTRPATGKGSLQAMYAWLIHTFWELAVSCWTDVTCGPCRWRPCLPNHSAASSTPSHPLRCAQSVVLLLQHGPEGSLGLVLNYPTCERLGQDYWGEAAIVRVSLTCSLFLVFQLLLLTVAIADACGNRAFHVACLLHVPIARSSALFKASSALFKAQHSLASLQTLDGPPNSRLYWGGPEGEQVLTLVHGGERSLLPFSCQVATGVWAVFDQDAIADVAAGDLVMVSGARVAKP